MIRLLAVVWAMAWFLMGCADSSNNSERSRPPASLDSPDPMVTIEELPVQIAAPRPTSIHWVFVLTAEDEGFSWLQALREHQFALRSEILLRNVDAVPLDIQFHVIGRQEASEELRLLLVNAETITSESSQGHFMDQNFDWIISQAVSADPQWGLDMIPMDELSLREIGQLLNHQFSSQYEGLASVILFTSKLQGLEEMPAPTPMWNLVVSTPDWILPNAAQLDHIAETPGLYHLPAESATRGPQDWVRRLGERLFER